MLQKNKNNKKVALSLIRSRRSFLLCQMKSFAYTKNLPGDVTQSRSSVSLKKVRLLLVGPFSLPYFSTKNTNALFLQEGPWRRHRFHGLPGALGAGAALTQQRRVRPRHDLLLLTSVATFLQHQPAVILSLLGRSQEQVLFLNLFKA